jgi:predicted 2-oxoglutarate/Fe(II)-dependent dioxygenase YbiX
MEVLSYAWLNAMNSDDHKNALKSQIDSSVQSLASAFRTTDATTFLDFIGTFFRQAAPDVSTVITNIV